MLEEITKTEQAIKQDRIIEITVKMKKYIDEYGGFSYIPVNKDHPYWLLQAELHRLSR